MCNTPLPYAVRFFDIINKNKVIRTFPKLLVTVFFNVINQFRNVKNKMEKSKKLEVGIKRSYILMSNETWSTY
jgi:hypothetical protein